MEYYDGELTVVQTGAYRGDIPINASLVTQKHIELASGFSWLIPDDDGEETGPAGCFIGLKDGKAVRIDQSSAVLDTSETLPEARNINRLCKGLYTFDIGTETSYGSGLLDADLKVIVPTGVYSYLNLAPGTRGDDEPLAAKDNPA